MSGTFNGSISTETIYSYTVTTNGGCQTMSSSGNITVKPDDELALNPPFNNNQTICEGETITPITYTIGGGTNGATISWDLTSGEPNGIIFDPSTMTISGQLIMMSVKLQPIRIQLLQMDLVLSKMRQVVLK